jgi:membrane fusion protein, multidrug efflux system
VPGAALMNGSQGAYVYLVNPDNTVSMRQVVAGPSAGDLVAINKGLTSGQTVVVDGADQLRDGAKIMLPQAPGAGAGGAGTHTRRNGAGGSSGGNGAGAGSSGANSNGASSGGDGRQHRHQHPDAGSGGDTPPAGGAPSGGAPAPGGGPPPS